MLKTNVLAFGLTHLTDARYFAAWGVDYLCFSVGEGGLGFPEILAIQEWVEGPICAVEVGNSSSVTASLPTIVRLPVAGHESIEDLAERLSELAEPIILDFEAGGITWRDIEGKYPFSPEALVELVGDRSIYLHIESTLPVPNSLLQFKLAVRGSREEKVGYKSFDDLDMLFEALED